MSELQVGAAAPDIAFLGDEDREVTLADLRQGGPVVLLFLRHFG